MEQIIDMPVHFFLSRRAKMPFYTAFQVILSAPDIDIKKPPGKPQSYPDIQPVYYAS